MQLHVVGMLAVSSNRGVKKKAWAASSPSPAACTCSSAWPQPRGLTYISQPQVAQQEVITELRSNAIRLLRPAGPRELQASANNNSVFF